MSCTQSFFTFALLSDAATGELSYVGPAGNGASGIGGGTPPPPGSARPAPPASTPRGSSTSRRPSHRVQRVTFPAPAGVATRLRMSLDVTVGPWYAPDPAART